MSRADRVPSRLRLSPMRVRAAATVVLLMAASSCSSTLGDTPTAMLIELAPYQSQIDIGGSITLTASVLDMAGRVITAGEPVVWTSAAPAVATVDATGKVTGVASGEAKISATRGGVLGSAFVTVRPPAPARIDIPIPSSALSRGDTLRLSARALSGSGSQYAGRAFAWSSSNLAVVQLTPSADSLTALITAISPGTATISATNRGVTGSITVTIAPDAVINVTPSSVAFVGTLGGADAAPQLVSISNGGGGTLRNLSVASVTYAAGQPSGWLQSSIGGTAAQPHLSLVASPRALAIGNYAAAVSIASAAPGVLPRVVNVTFAVAPPPRLTLASSAVTFGAALGGATPAAQSVAITNTGGGSLTGLAVSTPTTPAGQPAAWLRATIDSVNTAPRLTLAVIPTGLALGSYTANVSVSAASALDSPRNVSVTLTVSQNALIVAAPTTVGLTAVAGSNPSPATVNITNGGATPLTGLSLGTPTYGAGQPAGWLAASLTATDAPATLTLAATASTLAPGSYTATVPVRSSLPGVSPVNVTVNLTVQTAAIIVVSTPSVTLTASGATSNPSSNVGITNGGSGSLGGLSASVTYAAGQVGGWLTVTFAGGSTTAPTTISLQPRGSTLEVGAYNATVRLTSPNAPAPVDIAVTFNVSGSLQPADPLVQLFGPLGVGTSAPASTEIRNGGVGIITGLSTSVSYASGSGWLTSGLTASSTPATLLLQATADATATRGVYTASVTVSGTNVAPSTITVTRRIGYTFSRHLVTGTANIFTDGNPTGLGCSGCHYPGSRDIPFSSYDALVGGGYFNAASTVPANSYLYSKITAGPHGGGPYSGALVDRIRDWIIDGVRKQ